MIKVDGKYHICENIEDLNICRFIEMQVYSKLERHYNDIFSLLIYIEGEDASRTDESRLKERQNRFEVMGHYRMNPVQKAKEFLKESQKQLQHIFPTDFQTDDFLTDQIRQYLIAKLEVFSLDSFLSEESIAKLQEISDILNAELDETQDPSVKEIYQSFESLCFFVSQADSTITTPELKKLSVYDFYTYKMNVMEKIKTQQKQLKKHG